MTLGDSQRTRPLPQIEDLFYVALQALNDFDEPVRFRVADDKAIEITGHGSEPSSDARLRERLGFARSALKRIGAANNEQRGFWAITDAGREYLNQGREQGERHLVADINASYADRMVDAEFLEEAKARANSGSPMQLTVRELLEQWKVSRRGSAINQQIRQDLETIGLQTDPDFVNTWIDGQVRLISADSATSTSQGDGGREQEPDDDISLTVGSLESANRGVVFVLLDDDLLLAQSTMMLHDYSQLAVLSGPRTLRGAITWESIAQERLRNAEVKRVADCVVEAPVVRPGDHLLEVVPTVVDRGFVFVESRDRTLSGLVTMADLSTQFYVLANPFVLLGEIERWIRKALDRAFSPSELAVAVDPNDPDRDVESAASLTLGEMSRVVEPPDNWDRLGWEADRAVFLEGLRNVRRIRNETMHFSPDPLSEGDIEALKAFLRWIRHLMEAR